MRKGHTERYLRITMSLRTKLIIAFTTAIVVRLGFHLATGFVADDAFITFRYAENLASGYGFVYNVGERVLGTSTPLFTWLLALLATLRIPTIIGALGVSLVCSGLTAAVLYRLAINLRMGRLAWLPVIAYAFWPRSIPAETSGMETALFTLLITAVFYYSHRRLPYYAIGLATLASLTRPEGALLLVLVLIQSVRQHPYRWKSYIGVSAALIVPWLAFAHFYFESILPHSIPAKLALYSQFGTAPWWQNLTYLMAWHNPVGWLLTPLAVLGGIWLNRTQNFGRLETIWFVGMIAFFTFGQTHLFFWYVAPIYPIYLLFAAASAGYLLDRFPRLQSNSALLVKLTGLATIIVLSVGIWHQYDHYNETQRYFDQVLKPAAYYLKQQVTDDNELVAAEDIGYFGYYSGCRILDRDGLVSPVSVPYNSNAAYIDLIIDTRPKWVAVTAGSPISEFILSPEFLERYALTSTFGREQQPEYLVYHIK